MPARGHCSARVLLSPTESVHSQAGDAAQLGLQNLLGSQNHHAGCPGGREQPGSAGPGVLGWRRGKGRLHTERNQEHGRPGHSLDFSCPELSAGSSLKE